MNEYSVYWVIFSHFILEVHLIFLYLCTVCVCVLTPPTPTHSYTFNDGQTRLSFYLPRLYYHRHSKSRVWIFFSRAFAGSTPDITRLNPSSTASPSPALCDISHRCYSDRKPWESTAIAWIVSRCRLWKKTPPAKFLKCFYSWRQKRPPCCAWCFDVSTGWHEPHIIWIPSCLSGRLQCRTVCQRMCRGRVFPAEELLLQSPCPLLRPPCSDFVWASTPLAQIHAHLLLTARRLKESM